MPENRKGIKVLKVFLVTITMAYAVFYSRAGFQQTIERKKPAVFASSVTADYTQYVHMTQGNNQIFLRYPLGRIGLWSRDSGEIADSVTRNIRLYPVVNQTVGKDTSDWRGSITATPSETDIVYNAASPAKGSTVALTVTPNVSVYKYHFNNVSSLAAVGITLGGTAEDHGGLTWSGSLNVVDSQTIQATLVSGGHTTYYYIKFNVPGAGSGSGNQGYMTYQASNSDVTVAVALSQTSMNQAQQYLTNEFSDFNFAAAVQRLKDAWNAKLGKIDVQNADLLTKQQLYTGLYTVYANIVNATDGSPYASYVSAYGSPLLTIGSSIGWAYIGGGYFRAAFDQGRSIYYLLTLLDPTLMTHMLHTYQAQYDRDHVLLGNWDPYTPTAWTDQQWGFWGGMFLRANQMGVTGVDYTKAKNAIADTFGNTNNIMAKSGYLAKGYIPANGGVSNFMSRALDWATDINGVAVLANVLGDSATYTKFAQYKTAYVNNWDSANGVFRGKNADGSWAPLGNAGFFEGSAQSYAFDAPQDLLGLADLYGDATMTSNITAFFNSNFDYNDYEPQYTCMPIYSNSPTSAQNIARSKIIPMFHSLNMWEGSGGGDMYYTHNAGELVMAILGFYPYQSPGAQWVINSPAVTTAVIHGIKDITIQANNNSSSNIYISSIQVNGSAYPSHFISGKTLISQNTTITETMTNTPSRIASMYITGTDGEVLSASSDNATFLQYQNDPLAGTSRTKIFATKPPTQVTMNGQPISSSNWAYNAANNVLTVKGLSAGNVNISFGGSGTPVVTPQGGTPFSVTVCPHGLGNCGDGINPSSGGNTNPKHPQQSALLTLLDAQGNPVTSQQGTVTYNQSAQNFQGIIAFPNVTSGQYTVQVKMQGFLPNQVTGTITVTTGQQVTLPLVSLKTGDINGDGTIDILDYNDLISCFGSKQNTPSCTTPPTSQLLGADITDDGIIDGVDYNVLLRELSVQKGN